MQKLFSEVYKQIMKTTPYEVVDPNGLRPRRHSVQIGDLYLHAFDGSGGYDFWIALSTDSEGAHEKYRCTHYFTEPIKESGCGSLQKVQELLNGTISSDEFMSLVEKTECEPEEGELIRPLSSFSKKEVIKIHKVAITLAEYYKDEHKSAVKLLLAKLGLITDQVYFKEAPDGSGHLMLEVEVDTDTLTVLRTLSCCDVFGLAE